MKTSGHPFFAGMSVTRRLLQALDKTQKRDALFLPKDRVVVGLSGGPDSTALLLLLKKIEKKLMLRLCAAHLNHGLSPQAVLFERFCRKLAKKHDVPFVSKKVNVRKIARRNKKTIEEAGRDARYAFFCETARRFRAKKIATAHTLDDHAETVLMRLIRGSGLKGLTGIHKSRREGNTRVVRPLLDIPKKDLILFLRGCSQPYLVDASNKEQDFTRNRVRHRLLPLLRKEFNPRIDETLARLAHTASSAADWIGDVSENAWKRCLLKRGVRRVDLDAFRWASLPPAIGDEVIWKALECLQGNRLRIGYAHLAAIRELLRSPGGKAAWIHLPNGIRVHKKNTRASLTLLKG